jgi:hypothetical protein
VARLQSGPQGDGEGAPPRNDLVMRRIVVGSIATMETNPEILECVQEYGRS